jgi:hypothetical protein
VVADFHISIILNNDEQATGLTRPFVVHSPRASLYLAPPIAYRPLALAAPRTRYLLHPLRVYYVFCQRSTRRQQNLLGSPPQPMEPSRSILCVDLLSNCFLDSSPPAQVPRTLSGEKTSSQLGAASTRFLPGTRRCRGSVDTGAGGCGSITLTDRDGFCRSERRFHTVSILPVGLGIYRARLPNR